MPRDAKPALNAIRICKTKVDRQRNNQRGEQGCNKELEILTAIGIRGSGQPETDHDGDRAWPGRKGQCQRVKGLVGKIRLVPFGRNVTGGFRASFVQEFPAGDGHDQSSGDSEDRN